jgi:hypothetical protein
MLGEVCGGWATQGGAYKKNKNKCLEECVEGGKSKGVRKDSVDNGIRATNQVSERAQHL